MIFRKARHASQNVEEIQRHAAETGHRLKSRRDFLSQGLVMGVGTVLAPSLATLISARAEAQEFGACTPLGSNVFGRVAFLNIDLAGGPNLIGANFLVGGRGGQLDWSEGISYDKMSVALPSSSSVVSEFGIAFHPHSPILAGLRETTSPEVRLKIDGALFAAESTDDNEANQQNPAHWIVKSGTFGNLLPQIGSRAGTKAGRQAFPQESIDTRFAPTKVRTVEDARSLALATAVHRQLGERATRRVLEGIRRMSSAKLREFQTLEVPSQVRALVECGYLQSTEALYQLSAEQIDPSKDSLFLGGGGAFEKNVNGIEENENRIHAASVSKLVLSGVAGAGTIELGGRDYHGYDRDFTDKKDRELGQILGRIFTAASRVGRDVMVHVFADGSVVTSGPGEIWQTDSSHFSANILMVYKHRAQSRVEILRQAGRRQVGSYNSDGIDFKDATLVTDNKGTHSNMAKCVVANYLALHGEEGRLAKVVGPSEFDGKLDAYLMFNKIIS